MGKSKKKVIITASAITVIVILIVIGVILFLVTDLFKSDQELFYKYLAKNIEMTQKYEEDPNQEMLKQMEQNKRTIQSTVSFDLVSSDAEIANQTIPARNFTIDIAQKVDPELKRDSSDITLKFLERDLFNVKYLHNEDSYGVTSAEIINKYLTLENNNLKQLAQKYGMQDISSIPDKIELSNFSDLFTISKEDSKYLLETYMKVINEKIAKDQYFSKKNEMITINNKQIEANCYGVNLTKDQFKNLIIGILEQLKQDDRTLNLIVAKMKIIDSNTNVTLNTLKETIEDGIKNLNDSDDLEGITIQVYASKGSLLRTEVIMENGNKCTIDYESDENSIRILLSYEYDYANQTSNNSTMILKNIEFAKQAELGSNNYIVILTFATKDNKVMKLSMQNKMSQDTQTKVITNNTILNINDSDTTYYTIKVNGTVTPSNDVTVEELTSANSAKINDFTPEYTMQLVNAIGTRIQALLIEKQQTITKALQEENGNQNQMQTPTNTNQGTNTIGNNAITDANNTNTLGNSI